jgi:hypothetical protein
MLNRKANFYLLAVLLCTACTKQEILPTPVEKVSSQSIEQQKKAIITTFGLAEDDTDYDDTKSDMKEAGVNTIRLGIDLSGKTVNKLIDKYLADGYNVQIIVNWSNDVNGYRAFPKAKDSNLVKSQAETFFKNYADRKNMIPFIAVENEWDYQVQHGSNLQDYIKELSIITAAGHKYGFKIADGGITSGTLQRWTYSQLNGSAKEKWKNKYYVGLKNDYEALLNMVNTFIAGAKKINYDYSNVHWYNTIRCGGGFATASLAFMKASNKKMVVCNEFGIRTSSLQLFTQTVNEITGKAQWAIAYNGSNIKGKAIKLTDAMLQVLSK